MEDLGLLNSKGPIVSECEKLKVLEYVSQRTDCPWWVLGLEQPEVRDFKKKLEKAGIFRHPPYDQVDLRYSKEHGIHWVDWYDRSCTKVEPFSGIEYRRAAAAGVDL